MASVSRDQSSAKKSHTVDLLLLSSQIVMDSPGAGEYTIVVSCASIDAVEGPQSYSLVVSVHAGIRVDMLYVFPELGLFRKFPCPWPL